MDEESIVYIQTMDYSATKKNEICHCSKMGGTGDHSVK
jgi:hypothetical protein